MFNDILYIFCICTGQWRLCRYAWECFNVSFLINTFKLLLATQHFFNRKPLNSNHPCQCTGNRLERPSEMLRQSFLYILTTIQLVKEHFSNSALYSHILETLRKHRIKRMKGQIKRSKSVQWRCFWLLRSVLTECFKENNVLKKIKYSFQSLF